MSRIKILNRLKSLDDIEGVSVELSDEQKSLTIRYKTERSLDFYFKWVDENHFVGYFEDNEGEISQAVISLWTPMDAIHFSGAYSLLIQLRAGRTSPLD
jgi:hypothetical protein